MIELHVRLNDDGTFFHCREYSIAFDGSKRIQYFTPSWANEMPDFKRLDDGYFRCSVTDVSVEKLLAKNLVGKYTVDFDEEAQVVVNYWKLVIARSKGAAQIVSDFKLDKKMPERSFDFGNLSAYQCVGLVNSVEMPGYGLFMKQGTGKTAVAIQAIVNDAKLKNKDKHISIVVCPPNVRQNWKSEFEKFATEPVDVHIIRGGQIGRIEQVIRAIRSKSKIVCIVCNYETIQNTWDALSLIEFDYAILDEAHMIKSSKTKRTEYVMKLRQNSNKRLVLTGTPIANNVVDLFTLFEFMGAGTSGFRTVEGFKRFFGRYRELDRGKDVFEAALNVPILKDKLARFSFIITKEEAMPYLPNKVYDVVEVEMTDEQTEAYLKLRDELIMEIEQTLENAENEAVAVNNVLTQLLRLSQITSSYKVIPAIHDVDGTLLSPRRVIPFETNIKANQILEIAKEKKQNEKTIIWSNWVEDIVAIEEALKSIGEQPVTFYGGTSFEDRIEAERKFNEDPNCRWFIGNPAAGGTGLNLLGYPIGRPDESDTNCTHVIYVSQNWNAVHREQSEDRAHRRGTREPVRVTEIVVPNTIDVVIATRLAKKRLDAASMLDLREILTDIKNSI